MNAVNGELLALFEGERKREREACIATVLAAADTIARSAERNALTFDQIIEQIVKRIRSLP